MMEVQAGTWKRPGGKAIERAAEIRTHQASAGHRAVLWNTYVASLMLYPGQACEPPEALARTLRALCSQTFGARKWAPWWLLGGLGVQLAVKGAPKCLEATAAAAGVLAWLRTGGWGPPQTRRKQQREWRSMVRMAGGGHAALSEGHAATILQAEDERAEGGHPNGHGMGASLYAAAWTLRHGAQAARWRRMKSEGRRWMSTDGNEWELLRGLRFTASRS